MTEGTIDLITMGSGAAMGKAFNVVGEVVKVFNTLASGMAERRLGLHNASEDSRKRAEGVKGGVWMRRAIYLLIAMGFASVIVAPFFGIPVVVENVVQKGILFWKKEIVEYQLIEQGVVFLDANRRAFFALVAFYLGAKA